MLKGIAPSLHNPIEIVTAYNTYLLASLRCAPHQADTALVQYANSVRNELLPNIYQTKTEYEHQLLWQLTALSLHQYAMSIALSTESADTKRLAYKLVQVAKNLEIEADQYARTVMAKGCQANADLISRYDTMKDSLYFTDVEDVLDSIAMGIEMSKMEINEQIPIQEVFDNVSNYEQVRSSLPPSCTMVEFCLYRATTGEDRYGAFIFDSDSDTPTAVDVCSADDVGSLITKEKDSINELYNTPSLYPCLLANIQPHIKHSQLTLCPVGRLEHFNFSAFAIDDKRMMDIYQVERGVNGHLYMLYASQHFIFDKPNWKIDDILYYADRCDAEQIQVCGASFPHEQALSLFVPMEQKLKSLPTPVRTLQSEDVSWLRVSVTEEEGVIRFCDDYPTSCIGEDFMTRWAMYASMPLSSTTRQQLYPQFQTFFLALERSFEEEGISPSQLIPACVDLICHWIQTAFVYEYDDKVWGRDRAFFADETLYYPYCDCEDRSILLTRMVRDLLGLECALVYYPGHLASAIAMGEDVKGDYIRINGTKYLVCDPTYIGAPIGMTMPDMDNQSAKVMVLR